MWSLSFWMYLVEVGTVIDFRVRPKSDINGESGLSPIYEETGAEACGGILGTVVSVDQCSNTTLPVRLALWRQCPQHIN